MIAAQAQSLSGKWVAKYSSDDEAREIVLGLDGSSASRIAGFVEAPQFEDRIVGGHVSGNIFWFIGEREANSNQTRQQLYGGEISGDHLTLYLPGNRSAETRVHPHVHHASAAAASASRESGAALARRRSL